MYSVASHARKNILPNAACLSATAGDAPAELAAVPHQPMERPAGRAARIPTSLFSDVPTVRWCEWPGVGSPGLGLP